jgi:enediyne biosynthesis protein E4
MTTPTLKSPSLWLLTALCLLPACGSGSTDPHETLGTAHQAWLYAGPKDHGSLSGDGLPFLKWIVREQLGHCNENTDFSSKFPWCKVAGGAASNETELVSANHFNNCKFQEATELLNHNYQAIVAACDPAAPDYDKALKLFARVLHASQDFYAHSNWVESGQKGLVDAGDDYWTILTPGAGVGTGMTVLEGTQPPIGMSLERSEGSHRVNVTATGGVATLGLISGVAAQDVGEPRCPSTVSMEHGPGPFDAGKFDPALHLAKDSHNEEWRAPAAALAIRQTTHEFCRLRQLVKNAHGSLARQALDQAWVADAAAVERECGLSGSFVDKTTEWGLGSVTGTRLSVADINGDNYPDLLVRAANDRESNFQPDGAWPVRVLLNTRKGSFTDVTRSSGLLQTRQLQGSGALHRNGRASQVFAFADVDNDGALDAFSGSPSYQVDQQWVHPQLLRNAGYGEFALTTVALTSALSSPNARLFPGGASFFDYDRDGAVDLFLPAQEGTVDANPSAGWLFHHVAGNEARFSLVSTGATPDGARGRYHSSLATDLNGDGRPELLVGSLTRHPNLLWRNRGSGFNFAPAPGQVDPLSGYEADANQSWQDNLNARAFCDYRRQGRVAVARATTLAECNTRTCPGCPCDGDNQLGYTVFRLPTAAEELASCSSDGAGGIPAVPPYPAARAARKFADALRWQHAPSTGLVSDRDPRRLAGNTFTTIAADFDGDGKLDLYNATERSLAEGLSADPSQVLRNTTPASPAGGAVGSPISFDRVPQSDSNLELSHPTGSDWVEGIQTAAAFDADNDGRPDLYVGGAEYADNHGHLYRNTSSGVGNVHFDELSGFPVLPRSQGIAVADFDRDGDLDLVIGQSVRNCQEAETGCGSTERVRFIQNGDSGAAPPANWLQIRLAGDGSSNAAAIGARVSVELSGRTLVQEVDGGHGHFGAQAEQVLHFGLGALTRVRLTIHWPNASGTEQSWELDANRRYRVTEGEEPTELRIRGYCSDSVDRLRGRVGAGEANKYDDVFCLQDRLSALGFNGKPRLLADPTPRTPNWKEPYKAVPQQLAVNGRWTEDTEWALKTFQAAVGQSGNAWAEQSGQVRGTPPVTNPGSDPDYQTYVWLGASNAPHWAENPPLGTGWTNDDAARDNQDWGTSWTLDAINQAGSVTTSPFATNDLSFPSGGDTADHVGHESGRDIDIRNVGNWYADAVTNDTHLGAGNRALWSQPAPNNCARPSGLSPEALIDWLWQQNSGGNTGCIHAVQAAAPGSVPGTFEQGFNALVPLRPGYVRATVAARMRAFLAVQVDGVPLTERIYFTDPVVRDQVGDDRVRYYAGHSDHFHVSLGVPARLP